MSHRIPRSLRDSWINLILEQGLHKAFLAHVEQAQSTPPFSDECIDQFRTSLSAWLPMDWPIRDDQPMHLAAMQALSHRLHDPDSEVFTSLIAGVSAGAADDPILPSRVFWEKDSVADHDLPALQLHRGNWKSSEDHPELTEELIQNEIDQGWIFQFSGDEAEAQKQYRPR